MDHLKAKEFSIQTDGTIIPCPVMIGMKDYYLGHIREAHPLKLRQVHNKEPCTDCKIFKECWGRCLYANITKRWSKNTYNLVCKTVEKYIKALKLKQS